MKGTDTEVLGTVYTHEKRQPRGSPAGGHKFRIINICKKGYSKEGGVAADEESLEER